MLESGNIKFKNIMNKKLLVKKGIRKMQTAAGGPLVYEDEIVPNDNVWVDVLGQKKNPQLEDAAVRGASYEGQFRKDHPIAADWRDLTTALPFLLPAGAAASTILPEVVVGARALGTAAKASRFARGTAPFFKRIAASKPFRNLARVPYKAIGKFGNRVLSGLFFGHGVKKSIQEGGVSPVTALELASGTALVKDANNIYKDVKGLRKLFRNRRARQATSVTTPEVTPEVTPGVATPLAPPPAEITVNLDGIAENTAGRQAIRQAAAAANPTPTAAPVTTQAAPVTQAASTISPEAQRLQQFLSHYDTGDFSGIQYYDDLAKAVIDGKLPNLTKKLSTTKYEDLLADEQNLYNQLNGIFYSDTWRMNELQNQLKTAIAEGRSERYINVIKDQIRNIEQRNQNLGNVPTLDRSGFGIAYGGNDMAYVPIQGTDNIDITSANFFNPSGRPDVFLSGVWDQMKTGDRISIANGHGHLSINSLPLYLASLTRRLNQAMIDPLKEKGFLLEALSDRFRTNGLGKIPYRRYLIDPDFQNPAFGPEMAAKLQKAQQTLYDTYDQFNYLRKVGALGKSYKTALWDKALNIEKLPVAEQAKAWKEFFMAHPEIESEIQGNILNSGLIERLPRVQVTPDTNYGYTTFEYPGFLVTHLLFGGKLIKKAFIKKVNKVLKKGGLLKTKKIAKAQEGTNTGGWGNLKVFGKTALEQLPSIIGSIEAQKAARQTAKANEVSDEVADAEDYQNNLKKYYNNYKTYTNQLQQQAFQNGTTLNFSNVDADYVAHQLAWKDTQASSQSRKAKTKLKNASILAEGNRQLTNSIMGSIGKLAKTGYNLYANYQNNNKVTTPEQTSPTTVTPTYMDAVTTQDNYGYGLA